MLGMRMLVATEELVLVAVTNSSPEDLVLVAVTNSSGFGTGCCHQ